MKVNFCVFTQTEHRITSVSDTSWSGFSVWSVLILFFFFHKLTQLSPALTFPRVTSPDLSSFKHILFSHTHYLSQCAPPASASFLCWIFFSFLAYPTSSLSPPCSHFWCFFFSFFFIIFIFYTSNPKSLTWICIVCFPHFTLLQVNWTKTDLFSFNIFFPCNALCCWLQLDWETKF